MCWWLLLLLLTVLWRLAPLHQWQVMLAISLSILSILKTVVLRDYRRSSAAKPTIGEIALWYFAWPGLNAREFFARPTGAVQNNAFQSGTVVEWLSAMAKSLLGVLCLTFFVPRVAEWNRWVAGWLAISGLLLLFHFGGFHILALCWRQWSRTVQPIMHRPLHATSVNEFWSRRWNLAFRDFATQFVMRPLTRRWSAKVGLWGCFLFSGFVHELAISVPTGAGYGLPMGYFLLQAVGVSVERSVIGRRWGLQRGWRGWCFAFVIIGPPAVVLFHPPFLTTVILPLVGM